MSKRNKNKRSVRGHDEKKTIRYRQITTNVPIDRDGNPIVKKAQLPPSKLTAMAQAFGNSVEEQTQAPSVDVKANPKPEKAKAKVLEFKPKVVAKKVTPEHVPFQPNGTDASKYKGKSAANTAAHKAAKTLAETHGIVETGISKVVQTTSSLDKERSWFNKMAYAAATGSIYVSAGEAKLRQAMRLEMLGSGTHNKVAIAKKRFSKAQRAVALAHIELMKEHPDDAVGMYHGSQGVSSSITASSIVDSQPNYKARELFQPSEVVQTTSTPSKIGCEGVFKDTIEKIWGIPNVQKIASAARNDPSYEPDKKDVAWFANNVPSSNWPEDMADSIHSYLASGTPVIGSGETYRRNILVNSFTEEIKKLQHRIKEQDNELADMDAELNLLVWSDAIANDREPLERKEYVTQMGNKPTPSLPVLRNQLKTYMMLHRSDPVKNFLRLNGYNANDSERLKSYNAMRRAQLKSVRTEVAALQRIGGNIRSCLDNKRAEQWRLYVSDLGIRRDKQQAVIDVGGSLPKEREVYRKWGTRGFIDKPYLTNEYRITSRIINNEYVAWWGDALRKLHEPTASERLEKLLEKPVNKAAYKTVGVLKKINKVLQTDINPISRKKKRLLQEAQAKVRAERKAKRIKAKALRDQKRELKKRMSMVR